MNANALTAGRRYKTKFQGQIVEATFDKMYRDSAVLTYEGHSFLRTISSIEKLNDPDIIDVTAARVATNSEVPLLINIPHQPGVDERVDVNTRFLYIEKMVDMIVRGQESSFLVTGSGGLGKTHTVMQRLKENDLGDSDFTKISGHSTPMSLYRTLYENNDKMIVFDDCDSILHNETSTNILKASLDSYGDRKVSWATEAKGNDMPTSFNFTGRIIFISNYTLQQIPQPIVSRALYVDVTMTPDEKIDRIRAIAPQLCPLLNMYEIADCLDLLYTIREKISDLNFRTMKKVGNIRRANPDCWKDMAQYMITAKLSGK